LTRIAIMPTAAMVIATATETVTKPKKGRKKRDPNAPKKPCSAYNFFVESRRPAAKEAHPDMHVTVMNQQLAKEWRDLSEEDRQPFKVKAAADKARYQEENVGYVPDPTSLKATKSGNRLQKDPLRPKKPMTAYLYFTEKTRPGLALANPGHGVSALAPILAEAWKKLTDAQREEFKQMAEKDKARFQAEMKEYTPSEEYVQAREAFKRKKSGKPMIVEAVAEEASLESENAALKRQLAEISAQLDAQQKTIEKLSKEAGKKRGADASASGEKASKVAKGKATDSDPVQDEDHYVNWIESVCGAKGEKMDDPMKAAAKKGSPALAKYLLKRYKAEHGGKKIAVDDAAEGDDKKAAEARGRRAGKK